MVLAITKPLTNGTKSIFQIHFLEVFLDAPQGMASEGKQNGYLFVCHRLTSYVSLWVVHIYVFVKLYFTVAILEGL